MANETETTEGLESLSVDSLFEDPEPEPEGDPAKEAKEEPEKAEASGEEPEDKETEGKQPEEKAEGEEPGEPESGTTDKTVPEAALIGERRRRQRAEEELRQFRDAQEKAEAPDPEEDPEGHAKYVAAKAERDGFQTRIKLSREFAMQAWPDFEEMEQAFMAQVVDSEGKAKNPLLIERMQQAENPAKFAYDYMKGLREIDAISDPKGREAMKRSLREELKEELKAEFLKEMEKEEKKEGISATKLAGATAAGRNSEPIEEMATIDSIFSDSPF
jgi:hypothetical protein